MSRQRVVLGTICVLLGLIPAARAQTKDTATTVTPQAVILEALRANPVTGPYGFNVKPDGKQYVVAGRVGTKYVHDVAVRLLIGLGYAFRDDLIIDTREADRVASRSPRLPAGTPLVYPPPLFGRLDDPFRGFEPPLVSFPPDWVRSAEQPPRPPAPPADANAPLKSFRLSLNADGVALLEGRVPTEADRLAIAEEVNRVPGITGVVSHLEVQNEVAFDPDRPPPPPSPVPSQRLPQPASAPAPVGAEPIPAVKPDGDPLAKRVSESLARRPALSGLPLEIKADDGTVRLSGRVPSAYEAMLIYLAASRTPGVKAVEDRLEFPIPEDPERNPLRSKGRPEEIEAYLTAQTRRQLGDLAHVDPVQLRGDTLEVRGVVSRPDDVERAEAALRVIPLLRGFRLSSSFRVD